MDTLEWNSALAVRNKEPIITVREVLQDSENILLPKSSQTQPSRSREELGFHHIDPVIIQLKFEHLFDVTSSLMLLNRKPNSKKEQVSPAKRHRNGRGLGSIPLKPEHKNRNRGVTFVETERFESEKVKARVSDTPRLGKIFEQLEPSRTGVAPPPSPQSDRSRSGFSGTHEIMSIDKAMPSAAMFSAGRLPLGICENPRPHMAENKCEDIPSDTIEPLRSNVQEPEIKHEHISRMFESLYPQVEGWIRQQQSQLNTVTERINRILDLIQQGERLEQTSITAENATQLKNAIAEITLEMSQNLNIDCASSSMRQRSTPNYK
ncbi:hypothetical protein SBOR_2274 [Sclerotinia borealis F-4128]|uniref:Uncharacterized protein n=1 Tax=Sclerotinia borealis (strain F-4128) TaxID=1432307 RepID=W9CS00_SCLBF|nr:hypothetical protein SBOR_2274 [Sclerotinia borealis F-4128]